MTLPFFLTASKKSLLTAFVGACLHRLRVAASAEQGRQGRFFTNKPRHLAKLYGLVHQNENTNIKMDEEFAGDVCMS